MRSMSNILHNCYVWKRFNLAVEKCKTPNPPVIPAHAGTHEVAGEAIHRQAITVRILDSRF